MMNMTHIVVTATAAMSISSSTLHGFSTNELSTGINQSLTFGHSQRPLRMPDLRALANPANRVTEPPYQNTWLLRRHFVLAMITSACGVHMKTPDIKKSPHPAMRHEITMTLRGAPGHSVSRRSADTGAIDDTCSSPQASPNSGSKENAAR
jgi:hypothetical protein